MVLVNDERKTKQVADFKQMNVSIISLKTFEFLIRSDEK